MQLNIHELEARPDWPLIVTAVPCRTCEAQPGALCCDVGARKLSGQIITRADYHAERKYDAALAWLRRGEVAVPEATPVSAPLEEQPSTDADTGPFILGQQAPIDVADMVADIVDPNPFGGGGETGGAGADGGWDATAEVAQDSGAQDSAPVSEPDPYTVSDAPDEPVQSDATVDVGGTDNA